MDFIGDKNGFFQKPPDNAHFEKARVNDRHLSLAAMNNLLFDKGSCTRKAQKRTVLLCWMTHQGSDPDSITFTLTTQLGGE